MRISYGLFVIHWEMRVSHTFSHTVEMRVSYDLLATWCRCEHPYKDALVDKHCHCHVTVMGKALFVIRAQHAPRKGHFSQPWTIV